MSKALKEAIERNDPAAAAKAVAKVKDLGRRMPGATTPILYACQRGADAVIDVLLDAGAPPKGVDGYVGNSPLVIAMQHGHMGLMKRLVERGVVTKEQTDHAMFVAVLEGRVERLRFMLHELRLPPTAQLMHHATRTDGWAPELIRAFAEHGGDVAAAWDGRGDRDGRRPMHTAATNGSPSAVRTLAGLGADVNVRDDLGRTPIMRLARSISGLCMHNSNMARVRKLAAEGKARMGRDTEDSDPEATLAALIELGGDASLTDHAGNDALAHYQQECERDRQEPEQGIVEILTKAGAKGGGVKAKLFEAIRSGDVEAVRAALSDGADANASDPYGTTPLAAASNPKVIDVLLAAGADVNGYTHRGMTPLMLAAGSGDLDIVKRFVAAGADIHRLEPERDDEVPRRNALLAAEWNRKFEVVDYLKSIGGTRPKPAKYTPLKPGIDSWNDFDEIIVRADVKTTAAALAQMIKGAAREGVYGQSFMPGKNAFVVVRPRGMSWTNVFRIAPIPLRFEPPEVEKKIASDLAAAANAPVLWIQYSDTSGTATIDRFEPDGAARNLEDGWDRDILEEVVGELGDEATPEMKKRLASMDDEDDDSSTGLVKLAEAEAFNVAALGLTIEPGRAVDVEFTGYPAEAFDGVAWVSN